MIEENVVAATGVGFRLTREEIIRQIKDAVTRPGNGIISIDCSKGGIWLAKRF